ncbi:hypothetical protein BKA62DRAFT_769088 [Auriculariales sp. MPI-PUGE-AT-0066]|nr:hypothetical protein BKA62DRAFT_769088 [Auriculariales sp. MPI-PUGE-AT-0066]
MPRSRGEYALHEILSSGWISCPLAQAIVKAKAIKAEGGREAVFAHFQTVIRQQYPEIAQLNLRSNEDRKTVATIWAVMVPHADLGVAARQGSALDLCRRQFIARKFGLQRLAGAELVRAVVDHDKTIGANYDNPESENYVQINPALLLHLRIAELEAELEVVRAKTKASGTAFSSLNATCSMCSKRMISPASAATASYTGLAPSASAQGTYQGLVMRFQAVSAVDVSPDQSMAIDNTQAPLTTNENEILADIALFSNSDWDSFGLDAGFGSFSGHHSELELGLNAGYDIPDFFPTGWEERMVTYSTPPDTTDKFSNSHWDGFGLDADFGNFSGHHGELELGLNAGYDFPKFFPTGWEEGMVTYSTPPAATTSDITMGSFPVPRAQPNWINPPFPSADALFGGCSFNAPNGAETSLNDQTLWWKPQAGLPTPPTFRDKFGSFNEANATY